MGWTCRKNEEQQITTKITTEQTQRERKRMRGRPNRRCRDEIVETIDNNWMRMAEDRVTWRNL